MEKVKIGIVGVGNMGTLHVKWTTDSDQFELVAICDIDPKKEALAKEYNVDFYADSDEMLAKADIEAVIVATPHYGHTTIGIAALKAGKHLMTEKPISVHKADCERLIAAHSDKSLVFAAMFQQRTDPCFAKVRQLIQNGELGEITRVNWIITNWFRTESYYRSSDWRATWEGEGGGVLLNQCPHNLDLLQWICGMPSAIQGFCTMGKYHDIEVDDDVTAYMEFPNGSTGVFVTTTGEAPGTNRLEITGDRGKIIVENSKISFVRTEQSVQDFNKNSDGSFSNPEVWNIEIPTRKGGLLHPIVLANFADTIRGKAELVAPAEEGINSIEIANSIIYSSMEGKKITLPLDAAAYEKTLKTLIKNSTFVKKETKSAAADMSSSF